MSTLLDLRMPGDSRAVSAVSDAISETLTQIGIPEEKRLEIELAVQEALANAVVHGCQNDPAKTVHCHLERDVEERIMIVVTDPGFGFRTEDLADPNDPENLQSDHGRGVYLIRQLMDKVSFENSGSQIRMWKY